MTKVSDALSTANKAAFNKLNISLDASSQKAFVDAIEKNAGKIESGDYAAALGLMLKNLHDEVPAAQKQTAVAILTTIKDELAANGAPARPRMRGLTSAANDVVSQMPKLFEQLLVQYTGGGRPAAGAGGTVAFKPNAAEQWYPAMDKANDYAKSLGFAGVRHEGTGVRMRGLGQPPVDAIELQAIKLMKADGSSIDLGSILPEKGHLQSLKNTDALFAEMKGLIDAHQHGHGGGGGHVGPPVTTLPVRPPVHDHPTGNIDKAMGKVPASISQIYDVKISADHETLTVNPAPVPTTRGLTRGAVGVGSRLNAQGGRDIFLEVPGAHGAWQKGKFEDGAWKATTFRDAIRDSMKQHYPNKSAAEIDKLADAGEAKLAAAGYGLDNSRDVLVVTAKGDDSPIYLAMSKDPARPGCVSICAEVTVMEFGPGSPPMLSVRKPVVYFYPTQKTDLRVRIELAEAFAAQYPKANDGDGAWRFIATPDGTLFDATTERRFSYLFWEGTAPAGGHFEIDEARAHCVPGADAATFLERVSNAYQLSDRERTDFVTYWLPALERNKFNVVQLLDADAYGRYAKMSIEPTPDTVIRLFMIFRGSDARVQTGAPALPAFVRKGFAVIEWGGVNLDEHVGG